MCPKLSARYLCELPVLRWVDLRWGLYRDVITSADIVAYALCKANEGSTAAEISLAACDPNNAWAVEAALERVLSE